MSVCVARKIQIKNKKTKSVKILIKNKKQKHQKNLIEIMKENETEKFKKSKCGVGIAHFSFAMIVPMRVFNV
jgi:hypothetical protein